MRRPLIYVRSDLLSPSYVILFYFRIHFCALHLCYTRGIITSSMKTEPKGSKAARIRQRKYELIRQYQIPDNLLPGSLSIRYSRCNTPNCRCVEGEGHPLLLFRDGWIGKAKMYNISKLCYSSISGKILVSAPISDLLSIGKSRDIGVYINE